jgi:hypothetical protein
MKLTNNYCIIKEMGEYKIYREVETIFRKLKLIPEMRTISGMEYYWHGHASFQKQADAEKWLDNLIKQRREERRREIEAEKEKIRLIKEGRVIVKEIKSK